MTASLDWSLPVVVSLTSIVRERAVLATVADAIVAAAAGKSLLVAVACPDSEVAFVGHLTRALHARGRACRYLVSPPSTSDGPRLPSDRDATDQTVMVITSGPSVGSEHDVCRVEIRLTTDAPTASAGGAPRQHAGGEGPDADGEPDIFLDYHDPDGPTIRRILPRLSPRSS